METTAPSGMRRYLLVWLGLIIIVAVEVTLTYAGMSPGALLAALLSLAVIEAGVGVMYFMHLRYERRILFWSIVPTLVFVLILMNHLWRDARRMILLHL